MIEVRFTYGAQYLVHTEPLHLIEEPITSPQGYTINVGDKVHKIGSKVRTMFALKDGLYMQYQGVIMMGKYKVAIFNCPQHNGLQQALLFGKPVQYKYCFYMIEVHNVFICFLVGENGMRDIVMDDLELFTTEVKEVITEVMEDIIN